MIYQYYIIEIQQYQDGSYGDIEHFAWDEDPEKARLKAESKYYQVLSAAAVSELPSHAAILFSAEGFPYMHQCYKHPLPTPEPEPTPSEDDDDIGPTDPADGEPDPDGNE